MTASDVPTDEEFDSERTADAISSWVFVSHTATDESLVRNVLEDFARQRYLTLHIANRSQTAPVLRAYKDLIVKNLWRCSWFVVAISKNALSSSWVRFEVRCALRSKTSDHLLCLLLDRSDPSTLDPGLSSVRTINVQPLLTNKKHLRATLTRRRLGSLLPKGGLR